MEIGFIRTSTSKDYAVVVPPVNFAEVGPRSDSEEGTARKGALRTNIRPR